ncbi:MAG: Ig-like domain-containing protein [Enterobacterales bacterium]|nr:Ig-like domain-containing protein [Enterobacterales bacterium]
MPSIFLSVFLIFLAACGGGNYGSDTNNPPAVDGFALFESSPADNATNVGINTSLVLTLTKNIDAASVASSDITFSGGGFSFSVSGSQISIQPNSPLSYSTLYSLSINNILDVDGNSLTAAVSISFTTTTAPAFTLVSASPSNQQTNVAVNSQLVLNFSNIIDPASVSSNNISLTNTAISLSTSGTQLTITPNNALLTGTNYTLTVSNLMDTNGTAYQGSIVINFSTVALPPLVLVSSVPTNNATNIAVDTPITLNFNANVDPNTVTANNITLAGITLGFTTNATQVVVQPSISLQPATQYTLNLTNLADINGGLLEGTQTVNFTTASVTGNTFDLSNSVPASGATGVPINTDIILTFNANIDPNSVNTTNVSIVGVAATLSTNANEVIVNPDLDLANNSDIVLNISNLLDTQGNPLVNGPIVITFKTVAAGSSTNVAPTSKTFYVATNGNDGNDGLTIATAFATIKKASQVAEPGTTVEVLQGTYAGATITNFGSESGWITLKPYNNDVVVIDGDMPGSQRNETLYFYHATCDPGDPAYTFETTGSCQSFYWSVENMEIKGGSVYAVQIDTPDVKLLNNTLHDTPFDVVKVVKTANDVVIYGNEIYQTGSNATTLRNAQGIDIVGADRTWVANNYVHDIPSIGIYSKGNARNTIFENNIVTNTLGSGIQLGQSTDAARLIDGNYETYDGIIRNNLVKNTFEACLQTSSSFNVKIYNNSCVDAAHSAHAAIRLANESTIGQAGTNIEIKNNIIMASTSTNRPVIKISTNALTDPATLDIDNNLYWTANGSNSVTFTWSDMGMSGVDLSTWRTNGGQDAVSLVGDPLYTNPAQLDLTVAASSPAIDAAINTLAANRDFNGAQRPATAKDIGAFESNAILPTNGSWGLPTTAGSSELFRYPFIQSNGGNHAKIIWATLQTGQAEIYLRQAGQTTVESRPASKVEFISDATSGLAFYQTQVELTGLLANTRYIYDVVLNGVTLAQGLEFKTMPNNTSDTVNAIVFGDTGTQYSSPRRVRDAISSQLNGQFVYPHDLIIGVGDIAYNSGSFAEFDTNFFGQMSGKLDSNPAKGILYSRPYFSSLGNHDYNNSVQNLPQAYLSSFDYPVMDGMPIEDRERYYSFDVGSAHIIILDSMKFTGVDTSQVSARMAEMLTWLNNDLQSTSQTWKLVFYHHSVFSNAAHGTWGDVRENRSMRQNLLPVLQQNGVQLVMYGHDHMYQRSLPLTVDAQARITRDANGVIDQTNGITYVLTGHGGADKSAMATPYAAFGTTQFDDQVATWGIGYDFAALNNGQPVIYDRDSTNLDFGFSHLEITPTVINLKVYTANNVLMDSVSIQP